MVGFLLSVIIFGQISDLIGRFPTIIICYCITCVSMFSALLSNSYSMFVILRFFQAFGRTGIMTVGYVLVMEMVGSKHQTQIGIAIQLGWSIGMVTLVGVAWFFRSWFWLQLIISVAFVPFAFVLGEISHRVGRNRVTVMRIRHRWMPKETMDRRGRSHPPCCITARDDRWIVRIEMMDNIATSRTIAQ
ncbi:UNVERIFIED_CONTAM: Orct [Trichonephila clavipes]